MCDKFMFYPDTAVCMLAVFQTLCFQPDLAKDKTESGSKGLTWINHSYNYSYNHMLTIC